MYFIFQCRTILYVNSRSGAFVNASIRIVVHQWDFHVVYTGSIDAMNLCISPNTTIFSIHYSAYK